MILTSKKQIFLANLGIIALAIYVMVRVYFFLFSNTSFMETLYGLIFSIAEFFILLHTLGFFLTIRRVARHQKQNPDENSKEQPMLKDHFPGVAVVVAARHEQSSILENTFTALKNLNYPHMNLYFLDDSSDDAYKKEAETIAENFGAKLFRRDERHGAKAGIINDFLKTASEKYLAVFDADQNPMPGFLRKTVAILENRPNVAFVQTPQFYTNLDSGPVAKGAGMQQAIFYESICEGKGIRNSMFCCGTNVVFNREALVRSGGFDEHSVTEDFSTSLKFHELGYESVYYNHVSAFGMAPESLPAYFKQQIRWATGTINIFKKLIKNIFKNPKKLTIIQWWEYFLSGSYYFIGWAEFILMLTPIINVFFNLSPFAGNTGIYLGAFLFYFVVSLYLFFISMKSRNYSFSQVYSGMILGYLSFPVLMVAVIKGIFGKKTNFVVTTKGKTERLPFYMHLPYLIMVILSLAAGITDLYSYHWQDLQHLINLGWITFHLFILTNFYYFNSNTTRGKLAHEYS